MRHGVRNETWLNNVQLSRHAAPSRASSCSALAVPAHARVTTDAADRRCRSLRRKPLRLRRRSEQICGVFIAHAQTHRHTHTHTVYTQCRSTMCECFSDTFKSSCSLCVLRDQAVPEDTPPLGAVDREADVPSLVIYRRRRRQRPVSHRDIVQTAGSVPACVHAAAAEHTGERQYPSSTPRVPLGYPSGTPRVPSSTPRVPLGYPSGTPRVPLWYPSNQGHNKPQSLLGAQLTQGPACTLAW
jgi:hypothetical protein